MKPIFGINITADRRNTTRSGRTFIVARTPQDDLEHLEMMQNEASRPANTKRPRWLQIMLMVFGLPGVAIAGGTAKAAVDQGLTVTYNKAPTLIGFGLLCFAVTLGLLLYDKLRKKAILRAHEEIGQKLRAIDAALGIPEGAERVDVLTFYYTVKDGEAVATAPGFSETAYSILGMLAFVEGNTLYLGMLEALYAFDLAECEGIRKIDRRIVLPTRDPSDLQQQKAATLDTHYVLAFTREKEPYGIYFPPYALRVFKRLTGFSCE